jgi:transcriptional regulator with XRE-family HTH domain
MTSKNIHKGGRPKTVRPSGFYQALLREYENMTLRQMAEFHKVSRMTISRWLKVAREGDYEQTESTKQQYHTSLD